MIRQLLTLIIMAITAGAMGLTLYMFFRRLGKIEEERWGTRTDWREEARKLRRVRQLFKKGEKGQE